MSCDASVPEVLAGDPTRLAQVVTNLGSNAVKFTPSGEVYVRATAETDRRTGRPCGSRSATPASGSTRTASEMLFDTFTQGDASTTRVHGGTGLGLAISREIVHALGGEIGVESVAGKGSVVLVHRASSTGRPPPESTEDELRPPPGCADGGCSWSTTPSGTAGCSAEQLDWWQVRWDGVGVGRRGRARPRARDRRGRPVRRGADRPDASPHPRSDGLILARDPARTSRRTTALRAAADDVDDRAGLRGRARRRDRRHAHQAGVRPRRCAPRSAAAPRRASSRASRSRGTGRDAAVAPATDPGRRGQPGEPDGRRRTARRARVRRRDRGRRPARRSRCSTRSGSTPY